MPFTPVRSLVRSALVALAALLLATPPAPTSAADSFCAIAPRFEALRRQLGAIVGDCLLADHFDPNAGIISQPTTGGLLAWRPADNLTIFTDGRRIWTAGLQGLTSMTYDGPSLPWRTAAASTAPLGRVEVSTQAATLVAPLPHPPNAAPWQAHFILMAAEPARGSQRQTGVPASVTIAQAILESDWGDSQLSREYHNYFGIKAPGETDPGKVVWFDTWEVVDDEDVVVPAPFRAYASMVESFVDHGLFFLRNRRYRRALAVRNNPREFAREINLAGYATDPSYAPKLIALMDRHDLYAYDLP